MPLRSLLKQEGVDLLLARDGALGAKPGDGERGGTVGKAHGSVKVGAGELGRQQGTVEGVAGRRGIYCFHPKTRNERLLLPLAAIDPLRS